MPNLEIHYKEPVGNSLDFEKLGKDCQRALANAYNKVNDAKVDASDVLVRFISANGYDRGIPDICFVIKCGGKDLSKGKQLLLCSMFDGNKGVGIVCTKARLTRDVEMFNTVSHGFRKNSQDVVEFDF